MGQTEISICARLLYSGCAGCYGHSWTPQRHHMCPRHFCVAVQQLLLIHECRGFGASNPSSGQACRSGRKRRAGSRRHARTVGIQLPEGLLHRIFRVASQQLLEWVWKHPAK